MMLIDAGPPHPVFFQKILQGDYWLFSRINQYWTCAALDTIFLFMREAELWVPFYLFLLVFATLNFRKKGWIWSLYLIMTAIISDLISSNLIKNHLVYRLRPCHNPLWEDTMRFLANYCPESSSFTSSHACNHFAIAFFIYRTLRHTSPWWALVFPWAFFISYAQVYVGVHYPLDVICGGLVGSGIGILTSRVFRSQIGTLPLPTHNPSHA
jgi:membrane-associated phospholipid phosphatase